MEASFDTSVPWYINEAPKLQSKFHELITNYTNIQPQDVEKHVQTVRDKSWRVLALSKLSAYPAILKRLKSDPSSVYLEVGCGLAQDVRKLIADGAPAAQLRGTDLQAGLMACGHDLFRDAEALPLSDGGVSGVQGNTFVAADIFLDESDASPLKAWQGGVDIAHGSMFLHCFELPAQVRACKRITALLKPKPGSLLVGRSGGVSLAAGAPREEVTGPLGKFGGVKRTNYLHDVESFKEMWDKVGRETGARWEVKAVEEEIDDAEGKYFTGEEHRWLRYEVVRL